MNAIVLGDLEATLDPHNEAGVGLDEGFRGTCDEDMVNRLASPCQVSPRGQIEGGAEVVGPTG